MLSGVTSLELPLELDVLPEPEEEPELVLLLELAPEPLLEPATTPELELVDPPLELPVQVEVVLAELLAAVPILLAAEACHTETAEMVFVEPVAPPNIRAKCRVSSTL
jgi:hypothetical protein